MGKVVLFELNEVPRRVVLDFVARHPASALGALLRESPLLETMAPDPGHLSPWITWPTLHRGVTTHGIRHLGQDTRAADAVCPPLWKLALDAGRSAGVFASLHTWPLPADAERYAFYVPDPFASDAGTWPARLTDFQALNLRMSRASARNVASGVPWREGLAFLSSAPRLGLRLRTMVELGAQLWLEREYPHLRHRRRTWQSVIAFDLFMDRLRATEPDFCTFFTNHVASAQHRYWAASYPGDYAKNETDANWASRYADEIDFAMLQFDRMLLRLHEFTRARDYALIVTSSMGQAATVAQHVHTQLYLRDVAAFATALNLGEGWQRRPAMDPDVSLQVPTAHRDAWREALRSLRVGDQHVEFEEGDDGFIHVHLGQHDASELAISAGGREFSPGALGMIHEPIEDEASTTAYHIPEGILIVDGLAVPAQKLCTTHIAPLVLQALGVGLPEYMEGLPRSEAATFPQALSNHPLALG